MAADQEDVLAISDASHMLGVSESALRQWTDEGKIKVFVTPGGHRRYLRTEIKKFMAAHQKTLGIGDLATQLEGSRTELREIGSSFLSTATLGGEGDPQRRFAAMGRNILGLIIRLVTDSAHRDDTMQLIRDAGTGFGTTCVELGLPLTDSVQAFIQHRDPIVRVTTDLMKKGEGVNRRVYEAVPLRFG